MNTIKFVCTTLFPIFTFFSLAIGLLFKFKYGKRKRKKQPILITQPEPLFWTEINETNEVVH